MTIIFDGTNGITSPGGDTANTSYTSPILRSASSLTLQTNGSTTAVTIDTSQNVGIGTVSLPADTNLTVLGNFQTGFYRNVTSGARGYFLNIGARTSGGFADGAYVFGAVDSGDATGYLTFGTRSGSATAERMRIESGGAVGIGTNSVTSGWTFEVKGGLPAYFNNVSAANSPTYGGTVFYRGTNTTNNGVGISFHLNNSSSAAVEYAYIGGLIETNTAGSQNGAIIFAPTSANSRTERMRITSGGFVGINTSSPTTHLTVDTKEVSYTGGIDISNSLQWGYGSSINFRTIPTDGGSLTTVSRIQQSYEASNKYMLIFSTYNSGLSERMRITSGGNFLVGTTTDITSGGTSVARACFDSGIDQNAMKIKTNNANYATIVTTTSTANHFAMYMNNSSGGNVGYIFCDNTTTTYNTGSDYRLKENVAPMTGALARVQQLKPCTYTWKVDGSTGEGFIAHELQEIVPKCVHGEKDAIDKNGKPIYQGVDYSKLVITLTAAIQEQQAMIEELKTRIETLEVK